MYVYFDENGTLKEIVSDKSFRVGDSKRDKIYIYWEGEHAPVSGWVKYRKPNGKEYPDLIEECFYQLGDQLVGKTLPNKPLRNLKYFSYDHTYEENGETHIGYQFYEITIPDAILNSSIDNEEVPTENNMVIARIRFVMDDGNIGGEIDKSDSIEALGALVFSVETNIGILTDSSINETQYNYLIQLVSMKLGANTKSVKVTQLPSTGVAGTIYYVEKEDNGIVYDAYFWNGTEFVFMGTTSYDLYTKQEGDDFETAIQALWNTELADYKLLINNQFNEYKLELNTEMERYGNLIQSAASGSPKGVYATLADLQNAYPTGTSGIYVVSNNGHWYYWNSSAWADGGVYQSIAITDGSITTNMLNNDCLIKLPYLNNEDLNGVFNLGRYVAIGCSNAPTNHSYLLEVQRYKTALENNPWVVQIAYSLNDYQKYYRVYQGGAWNDWKKLINDVNLSNILLDYVSKNSLFDYTDNLANPDKIIEGQFIDWQSGGIATSEDYRLYNDYIDVEEGNTYIALLNDNDGIFYDDNYAIIGAFYDSSTLYVDEIYITIGDTRGATFVNGFYKLTVPIGAKYFKFSVKDNVNHYKWFVTKNIQNFVKYGQVKNQYLENGGKLQGKTIVNFGDSIFGNTRDKTSVSSYLSKKTGAIVYNCGFGGCQMSKHSGNWDLCSMYQLANDIKNKDFSGLVSATTTGWSGMPGYFVNTAKLLANKIDFSKVDYITISYGTNDYREGDSVVGNQVNIFDGNFDESGFINPSTGEDAESSSFKRTSKYYPIKSVSNLYLRLSALIPTFVVLFYDFNGNYLGYSSHNASDLTYTLTVPSGAVCYRVYVDATYTSVACLSYEESATAVPYFNNEDVIDCLKYSIRTIQKAYPDIKILVTTPIYRSFLNSNNEVLTNSDVADFGGGTLEDYSQAYKKACEELKVPCLDLYHLSQLNKETRNYYYPVDDGTHPNEKGREAIAGLIAEELEKILN